MYHVYGWSPAAGWTEWRFMFPPYRWGTLKDVCSALQLAIDDPPPALGDTYVFMHHWDGQSISVFGPGAPMTLAAAREYACQGGAGGQPVGEFNTSSSWVWPAIGIGVGGLLLYWLWDSYKERKATERDIVRREGSAGLRRIRQAESEAQRDRLGNWLALEAGSTGLSMLSRGRARRNRRRKGRR